MIPRLIGISGALSGAAFPLGDDDLVLGRGELSNVVVPDRAVSRRHCLIRREGKLFKLIDLQSRNGCFVNNVPVREHELKHSDRITIGDSHFVFLLKEEECCHSSLETVELDDSQPISGRTVRLQPRHAAILHPERLLAEGLPGGRQARDLEALLRICQALDSSRDVGTLARGLMDLILELIPADRGAVLVAEESGEVRAVYGCWPGGDPHRGVPVSTTLVREVLATKEALMCNDVLQDTRVKQTESMVASPITALLVAPIMNRGQFTGVIYLAASNPVRPFEDADLQLVAGLASVSAPAFESARQVERLHEENRRLRDEIEIEHRMVGTSPGMEQVYRFVERAARADATVLITGESGTGKELVARALRLNGPRSSRPFVAVNSAAIPENLMESEIFGHVKGAFTGAVSDKKGLLEAADGGTLFLDEIGDMPLTLQAKLLRVIQERQFERLGGTETLRVDIRIIAATHRNLEELIKAGTFREDLYFRLNVLPIHIPPLRERRDDIVPLAHHFLNRHRCREKRRDVTLSPEAGTCLRQYDWPGNVRELESAIERAVVLTSGTIIQLEDLPEEVRDSEDSRSSRGRFHDVVREAKKQAIIKAFKEAGGVYTETARLLGLQVTHLHRVIRTLSLKNLLESITFPRPQG
jgi:transcriptional regulator with GAF, ATPase, and Fis domain